MLHTSRHPLHRFFDRLTVAVFLVAIATPVAVKWIAARGEGVGERKKAAMPTPGRSVESWEKFPPAFSAWYADHFGGRAALIRWHARMKLDGFGVSPSETVIVGKDGWLFYADDGALQDYRRVDPMPAEAIVKWQEALERRRDWCQRRGIRYVLVLAPEKHTIYPEFMPDTIRRSAGPSRADQMLAHLRANSTLEVVSLREPLLAAKATGRLFHKTDTHWNDRGAYVGYAAILSALGMEPWPADAFEVTTETRPGQDLMEMLGVRDATNEAYVRFEPRRDRRAWAEYMSQPAFKTNSGVIAMETGDASLPRAVMLRDSYASALVPFVSEHFERIVYSWTYQMETERIEHEKPDVVIQEICERRFYTYELFNPEGLNDGE